jgi:hypothetical protein
MIPQHHPTCDYWQDQCPDECTCGATAKRAPWADRIEQDFAKRLAGGNAAGLIAAQSKEM